MEKNISVIIPVYNVEKYLAECLDSVIGQTLREIEIICVNDGSLDRSREILAEYAEQDVRIRILDKPNGGLSSARNMGLKAAQGRYILFLDSDDFLKSEDALYTLYQKAETEELEQLFFDAEVFFENEEVRKNNLNYIDYYKRKNNYSETVSGKEMFCKLQSNWDFKPSACMQILRRDFLMKNNLRFCEDIVHEDKVFNLKCINLAKKVAYINQTYYMRRVRDDSIMTTEQKKKHIYGYYYGVMLLIDFAQKHITINDKQFIYFFFQRIGVLMELAARPFYLGNIDEKFQAIEGIRADDQIVFAVNMQAWEKIVSLKERLRELKDKKQKIEQKYEEAGNIILIQQKNLENLEIEQNNLLKLLDKEKESVRKLNDELCEEKRKAEKIKQSHSYKIGKTVTWIPRKVKKVLLKQRDKK